MPFFGEPGSPTLSETLKDGSIATEEDSITGPPTPTTSTIKDDRCIPNSQETQGISQVRDRSFLRLECNRFR